MIENRVVISPTCCFVEFVYSGNKAIKDICLEYVEHSTDHWYPSSETSIDIDKEKAIEIINFLRKSFGI